MKGTNEIKMNLSTVLEAMQLWLDSKFKNPPQARAFEEESGSDLFVLMVEGEAETNA